MKNIIKTSIFLAIFLYIFIKLSYVLRPHEKDRIIIKTYIMQRENSIDVVCIGTSACLTSWIPMNAYDEYGFTSFNFGSSALPQGIIKYSCIEALKYQSPEVLVIDVRNYDLETYIPEEMPFRYMLDSIKYSYNRFCAIKNGLPEKWDKFSFYFDIVKYHGNLYELTNIANWKYAFNILEDEAKCFAGYRTAIRYRAVERNDNQYVHDEELLSEENEHIYEELVDYCKNINMNVLFVIAPNCEIEIEHKKHNYMRRLAEENNISFLDANDFFDEIGIDTQTDFYNIYHMNVFGAQKYTKWLGKYLSDNYDLPDRRDDVEYSDWNTAYELWVSRLYEIENSVLEIMPDEIQMKVLQNKIKN